MRKILKRSEEDARRALRQETQAETAHDIRRTEVEGACTGSQLTSSIRPPMAGAPPATATAPSVPVVAVASASTDAGPFRVLVAEDTEMNRQLVRALLARMGCEVALAENGQQALEVIKQGHVDLVLMDCLMPVLDGYEATGRLRLWERQIGAKRVPVIALTGNASEGDRTRCIEAGMDDFLAKPFTADTFMETVGRWMRPRRLV